MSKLAYSQKSAKDLDGQDGLEPDRSWAVRARPLPRISMQAFCEDINTAEVLADVQADRRLAKTQFSIQMGGSTAALAYYAEAPTPNLIMIESTARRDQLLTDLDRLAQACDEGTKVVVIGHLNDIELYRELIRRGVSEYLMAPLTPLQVMECLSGLYNDPAAKPVGHVIAFVGAKGGVGSSTVCHNVGYAMAEVAQNSVVIADFDLAFGTAGLDFNLDPIQGLADAVFAPERLDEQFLDRLLHKCSDRLSLLAAPSTLDREYDLSPEACEKVVDLVRQNVPYLVVDLPHVWTKWSRQLLMQADDIVITATSDLGSLRNAKNLVDLLKSLRKGDTKPQLVLNQLGVPKRPDIPVKDFASALGIQPTVTVDFDPELFGTAANNGQMIEELDPRALAAEHFRKLASILTNRHQIKQERNSGSSLLKPLLDKLNRKK